MSERRGRHHDPVVITSPAPLCACRERRRIFDIAGNRQRKDHLYGPFDLEQPT
jgi:hypothetical protein